MGLFSRCFKKSTKADKKEKRLSTGKKRQSVNAGKPKYHHIPTHAAVDALSGAPPCYRKADQARVREINQRKSQLLMFGRDSSMAEFLRNMPQPPGSEGPGAAYTPTATPRWKRETARGRNSAFMPLEVNISISPVRSGPSSSEASPVPSLTSDSSHVTSVESVASTFDLAYRQQKRPHPRPKVFAHNDVFARLQSTTGRKLGETIPNDDLFNVSPDKSEISSEYSYNSHRRQPVPVLKQGPRHSVMKRQGGQRPPSLGIVTILE